MTGLQFFFTDYALNVIHAEKEVVYMHFSIFGTFAPVFGVLFGAYIMTKIGGGSSPQALGVLCLAAFFATVVALPIPFL